MELVEGKWTTEWYPFERGTEKVGKGNLGGLIGHHGLYHLVLTADGERVPRGDDKHLLRSLYVGCSYGGRDHRRDLKYRLAQWLGRKKGVRPKAHEYEADRMAAENHMGWGIDLQVMILTGLSKQEVLAHEKDEIERYKPWYNKVPLDGFLYRPEPERLDLAKARRMLALEVAEVCQDRRLTGRDRENY